MLHVLSKARRHQLGHFQEAESLVAEIVERTANTQRHSHPETQLLLLMACMHATTTSCTRKPSSFCLKPPLQQTRVPI